MKTGNELQLPQYMTSSACDDLQSNHHCRTLRDSTDCNDYAVHTDMDFELHSQPAGETVILMERKKYPLLWGLLKTQTFQHH